MATVQVPIPLTVPDASGNAYPALFSSTNREVVPAFVQDVDGDWWGIVRVPQDYVGTPKIILSIAANATTGVSRLAVASKSVADAEAYTGALTVETSQDITVPATAHLRKDVTFTIAAGAGVAAGEDLVVKITHEGAHVNDTLAVDTLLFNAVFQYANA